MVIDNVVFWATPRKLTDQDIKLCPKVHKYLLACSSYLDNVKCPIMGIWYLSALDETATKHSQK